MPAPGDGGRRATGIRSLASGWAGPVAVALLAFVTFAPTLGHGFVYDDGFQVVGNPWLRSAAGLPNLLTRPVWAFLDEKATNFYRPVMSLLHFAAAQLFGRRAFGFHLVAVLMHAVAAAAALALLRRIAAPGVALFAAALFAVHPIHAESVAWISGSPDVNATVFLLAALTLWDRARAAARPVTTALPAAAACLLACFSKETALVAPLLALLLPRPAGDGGGRSDGPPATRAARRGAARVVAWCVAFVVPPAIYLAARAAVIGTLRPMVARPDLVGAPGFLTGVALVPRYLLLAFAPLQPAPDRLVTPVVSLFDAGVVAGLLVIAAAVAAWVFLRRRAPAAAFGIALLLVPLAPALQVVYLSGSLQADRYLYLPALGACLLVATMAEVLWRRAGAWPPGTAAMTRRIVFAGAIVLVGAGAARAAIAAGMWRDSETLGRAGIALEPRTVLMRLELVHALDAAGRRDEALAVAQEAAAIAPGDPRVVAAVAGLRARAAEAEGGDAVAIYRAALEADPSRAHLWVGLSEALLRAGRPQEAIEAAEKALAIERFNTAAIANLGTARGETGDAAGEEREARRLLEIDPGSAAGHLNLGVARLRQDDLDGAAAELARAASLDPTLARAHLYLSWIAARRGGREEALREAERAVALDGADAEAWNHLGATRAQAGDRDGARTAWEKALAIRPDDPQAKGNLERLSAGTAPAPR